MNDRVFLAFVLICGVPSCAAQKPTKPAEAIAVREKPAADVDPVKAATPLEKVPDAPAKAARPEIAALSERASKQLATANTLIGEQRYTEAALELERALRFEPNHPAIQEALASLHWQAGNIERARLHAGKALEGNPDSIAVHYILGRCAAQAGEASAAVKEYRAALLCSDAATHSDLAVLTHYHLAESLAKEGYYEASLAEYEAFERLASKAKPELPEAVTLIQSTSGRAGEPRSQVLEKLGRIAEAADALAPVVQINASDSARVKRLADLLMRSGRTEQALTTVRSISSDDPDLIELLFHIHERAGHPERMVDDLRTRAAAHPDDSRLTISLADILVRVGSLNEAADALRGFLDRHPESFEVRSALLEVLIKQSKWAPAMDVLAQGIERDEPKTSGLESRLLESITPQTATEILRIAGTQQRGFAQTYLLGRIAATADQPDESERYLTSCLDARQDFTPCRAALAGLYMSQYRYEDALRIAGPEPENSSNAALERVRGEIYERLDNSEQAEVHLRRATQLERTDTHSMLLLAQIYRRTNRSLQAQRQLRVLLDQDKRSETARELLALIYVKEGKLDTAVEEIEELRRLSTNPCTIARCNAFLDPQLRRNADARRAALLAALKAGPPDAATWLAVAETYEDDQPREAREACSSALRLDPDNEDAALGLMRADERLLKFEDATEQLTTLLKRRPNRHAWRLPLIRLNWILNNFEQALAIATQQEARLDIEAGPRSEYRRAILATLAQADRRPEAIDHLKRWIEESPNDQDWMWRDKLVKMYIDNDQPAQAVAAAEELYRLVPREASVREDVIQALQAAKRPQRASQYTLEWLEEDPDNDQNVWLMVTAMDASQRLDDAIELVRRHMLQTANREPFQNLIVKQLSLAKRHAEAISYIESLQDEAMLILRSMGEGGRRPTERPSDDQLIRRPNEPWSLDDLQKRVMALRVLGGPTWPSLAMEMIAAKRYRETEVLLNNWLENANDPQLKHRILLLQSTCYRAQGNEEQGAGALEKALTFAPDHPTLNNDIAYMWIDRGVRLDEAELLIRYAVGKAPMQAAYLDTYGWLLYKRGKFDEAKVWLDRANRFREDKDPVINDHLGDCLWMMKDSAGAIEHWTKAVQRAEERHDEDLINDDEKRVRDVTPKKIEEAKRGGNPPAATVGEKK